MLWMDLISAGDGGGRRVLQSKASEGMQDHYDRRLESGAFCSP
jgi:hypothetical protein